MFDRITGGLKDMLLGPQDDDEQKTRMDVQKEARRALRRGVSDAKDHSADELRALTGEHEVADEYILDHRSHFRGREVQKSARRLGREDELDGF